VGQSDAKSLTIRNTGRTNPLIIAGAISSDPEFVVTGGGSCGPIPVTLAAKGSCTLAVSFAPSAAGPHSASLTLTDNTTTSPQHVALSGNGLVGLTLTKDSLVYGNVHFGLTGVRAFAVVNHQTQPVSLSESFSGPNSGDFSITGGTCTATLDAHKACSIVVTFRPGVLGTESATLTVANSPDPLSPYTVALSTGPTIPARVTPIELPYGTLTSKTPTRTKNVTVTNLSGFPLSVSVGFSGLNAPDFAVTGGTCGSTAPPNMSCTIAVTFTPTGGGSAENATAAVTIGSDPTSPHNISLTGTGP
jgi:Abnormal spindle-like microcephaly-assoc'd, ASPM-SPD-2-Hydin